MAALRTLYHTEVCFTMGRMSDFHFPSANGVNEIHCRLWTPDGGVRGVVQMVHGVAEHIGRYNDFAEFLTSHGFAAVGDDHLGHGLSVRDDSELGWFAENDGWDLLIKDEKTLRDRMQESYPGTPLVLLGHSMGSFIARTYIGEHPDDFTACILSGTGHTSAVVCSAGLAMARSEVRRRGSKYRSAALQKMAFGSYLKGIQDPIGSHDWICRDPEVIRAYTDDPLCGWTATAGLMRDMMTGLSLIRRGSHMRKMNRDMPVLFISGTADPVGSWGKGVPTVANRFLSVGMRDITLKMYPEARHEVLNELNRQEVWMDVLTWLEKKAWCPDET